MKRLLLTTLAVLAAGACAAPSPPRDTASAPPGGPPATAAPAAPCEAARARGEAWVFGGRLERGQRALDRADAACPAEARRSRAARAEIAAVLGRPAREEVEAVARDPQATEGERASAVRARAWLDLAPPSMRREDAAPRLRRARVLARQGAQAEAEREAMGAWVSARPYGEALALAGMLALGRGDREEAERRFARARAELAEQAGASPALDETTYTLTRACERTADGTLEVGEVTYRPPGQPAYATARAVLFVDPATRTIRRRLDVQREVQIGLAGGEQSVVVQDGHEIRVLDAELGTTLTHIVTTGSDLTVSLAPDGRTLARVEEARVVVVDALTGSPRWEAPVRRPSGFVLWSSTGKRLLTSLERSCDYMQCGADKVWDVLQLRDARTGRIDGAIDLESWGPAGAVAWTPDDARVLVQLLGPAPAEYDGRTGFALPPRREPPARVPPPPVPWPHAPHARIDAAATIDGDPDLPLALRTPDALHVVSLTRGTTLVSRPLPETPLRSASPGSPSTRAAFVFGAGGASLFQPVEGEAPRLAIVDVRSGRIQRTIAGGCSPMNKLAVDAAGLRVAAACTFSEGVRYAGPDDASFATLPDPTSLTLGIAMRADGSAFAALGVDLVLRLFDTTSPGAPRLAAARPVHYTVPSLAFSPNGSILLVDTNSDTMLLYDGASLALLDAWKKDHLGGALAYAPSGDRVVSWGPVLGEIFAPARGLSFARFATLDAAPVPDMPPPSFAGQGATVLVPRASGAMDVVRLRDGRILGTIVAFAGEGGAFLDAVDAVATGASPPGPGGRIELLGGARTYEGATCRFGEIGVPFEVCAGALLEEGALERRLRGEDGEIPP